MLIQAEFSLLLWGGGLKRGKKSLKILFWANNFLSIHYIFLKLGSNLELTIMNIVWVLLTLGKFSLLPWGALKG